MNKNHFCLSNFFGMWPALKTYAALIIFFTFSAYADTDTLSLKNLSLDELSNQDIVITSANKKSQKLSNTAAAIFVITDKDIQNSGVTTIPDALRMAPGIHVARIDVNKWSVTARGFSGRFANKLLVLMDGRTIYSPLFSGVYWDTQNSQLDNIDRIEIIRGPAAAMWGSNAVNGVVNIITKSAENTQGFIAKAGIGSEVKQGFLRYGGKLNDTAHYRLYADYNNHEDSTNRSGTDTSDQWDLGQTGFRLDWKPTQNDNINIQGDYYAGRTGHNNITTPLLTAPYSETNDVRIKLRGANFISRWRHAFSETDYIVTKFYFDHVYRKSNQLLQQYDTFDFDINHHFKTTDWHEVNWGLGYRLIDDKIDGKSNITLDPVNRTTQFFSGFFQNEIALIPNTLISTIALRAEHNDYSGFEFQPTARLLWTPDSHNSLWAAFSRAVRPPLRSSDIRADQSVIPGTPPRLISIQNEENIDSEEVYAYEIGYKFIATENFKINFSAFYNIYDELRSFEQDTPRLEASPSPVHILIPIHSDNKLEGETYGIELSSSWRPTQTLTLNATYTYTKLNLHNKDNSLDLNSAPNDEGATPQQQFSLRTDIKLSKQWSTNLWFRYVDSLPSQSIKSYLDLHARLAWKINKQIQLSVIGQNLLAGQRNEYNPEIISMMPSQIERSILGKLSWTF